MRLKTGCALLLSGVLSSSVIAQVSIGGSPIPISDMVLSNDQISIEWEGGLESFQVQSRTSLVEGVWGNHGSVTADNSYQFSQPADPQMFFQVLGSDAEVTAQYQVNFISTWSATTHPTNFPSGNEHYSPLIGGTHNAGVSFWEPGGTATVGIEVMAETGYWVPLENEVNAAITAGAAEFVLLGGALGFSPGSIQMNFNISQNFPLVTLVTMIAPSPDWFVGVHGLNLFVDGDWVDELNVPLYAYDAGTDSGISYNSTDSDTIPKDSIQLLTGFPVDYQGSVAPFGSFIFTRTDIP